MIDRGFWKDRRVLVTGHTGFKGSWLCGWLSLLGARVTGLAHAPESDRGLYLRAEVGRGVTSILGDIRDKAAVDGAMAQATPEVVFHLAAQSLVRPGYRDPVGTFATNVVGTAQVLDASRRSPVKAFVSVTSDKCYQNHEWAWGYREDDRLGGHDPYSASKACAELVTSSFRDAFLADAGVGVATVRAGNVIGGGDRCEDRLIPDIVRAWECDEAVLLRNPLAIRPWQHVLEPIAAYLGIAERLIQQPEAAARAWNIGPDDADVLPVGQVAERLIEALDAKPWVQDSREQPHEAHLLRLDSSEARSILGIRPRLSCHEAIDWVADWAKADRAGKNMVAETRRQIEEFSERGH